jgi:hypothetical protein
MDTSTTPLRKRNNSKLIWFSITPALLLSVAYTTSQGAVCCLGPSRYPSCEHIVEIKVTFFGKTDTSKYRAVTYKKAKLTCIWEIPFLGVLFWIICRIVVSTSSPVKDRRVSDVDFEEIWNYCWCLVSLLYSFPFKKMGNVTTKHSDQMNVIRDCCCRWRCWYTGGPRYEDPPISVSSHLRGQICVEKYVKMSCPHGNYIRQQETVAPSKKKALGHGCRSSNNIQIQEATNH